MNPSEGANNIELVKCIVGQKPEKKEVHLHLKDSEEVLNLLRKLTPSTVGETAEKGKSASLTSFLAADPLNV